MNLQKRITAFTKLGTYINNVLQETNREKNFPDFQKALIKAETENQWFTGENILFALRAIGNMLKQEELVQWTNNYPALQNRNSPLNVGAIMAGNIPLVSFHDFLCILISGHIAQLRLSSKDSVLLQFLASKLISFEPEFSEYIFFLDKPIKNPDAIIATGSNNSSRYFDFYFAQFPHIIRRNRNSVAVLDGSESHQQLELLADDIFCYFGLGCRNITKLFVPKNYNFSKMLQIFDESKYSKIALHSKYSNNFNYYKTIYMMNLIPILENSIIILKEDTLAQSPPAVLFYEYYTDIKIINQNLLLNQNNLQCIVSANSDIENALAFGTAQTPQLNEYADRIDTVKFLTELN